MLIFTFLIYLGCFWDWMFSSWEGVSVHGKNDPEWMELKPKICVLYLTHLTNVFSLGESAQLIANGELIWILFKANRIVLNRNVGFHQYLWKLHIWIKLMLEFNFLLLYTPENTTYNIESKFANKYIVVGW